jgi:hypothetical protein
VQVLAKMTKGVLLTRDEIDGHMPELQRQLPLRMARRG